MICDKPYTQWSITQWNYISPQNVENCQIAEKGKMIYKLDIFMKRNIEISRAYFSGVPKTVFEEVQGNLNLA